MCYWGCVKQLAPASHAGYFKCIVEVWAGGQVEPYLSTPKLLLFKANTYSMTPKIRCKELQTPFHRESMWIRDLDKELHSNPLSLMAVDHEQFT